ncbi:MAG: winged helix-turn-helix protein [Glaciihabitans sp.]|nr:winged helix-turn-helix protein [Glaciihabitans sp.]
MRHCLAKIHLWLSGALSKLARVVSQISPAQARRIALAAQGFDRARPGGLAGSEPVAAPGAGTRTLASTVERLGILQLDSVNVFERSHYLPLFSRLGAYNKADLDRITFGRNSRYTEYWAHEAAIIPLRDRPLWHWKMDERRAKNENDPMDWIHSNREMLDWLRAELRDKGPLTAGKIEHDANKRRGGWWEWSDVKVGLERLFAWGELVSVGRTRFERTYGLAEQALPAELLNTTVSKVDALRVLLARGARAHGIGVAGDIGDYYRIKATPAKPILQELVDEGVLLPVTVPGWTSAGRPQPAYLHRDARIPRKIDTAALLSPFDPVVWDRGRALRMFDFHYRIEIYTPEPKRIFGYYTLPVIIGDSIVARIDLKSDRQNGVLRVQSAWNEKGTATGHEARIAQLLRDAAAWQGLGDIEVVNRGDLSHSVAAELGVHLRDRPPRELPLVTEPQ